MKKLICILFLTGIVTLVKGQDQRVTNITDSFYPVSSKIPIHDLRPFTFVFADTSNELSLQQITSGKFDDQFKHVREFNAFKDYTSYWLRISVTTEATGIKNWWLMLRDSTKNYFSANTNSVHYNFVDVYFCDENKNLLSHQRTGLLYPKSQKSIPAIAGISRVLFSAAPGKKQIIYLKIYNEMGYGTDPAYIEIHDPAVPLPEGNLNKKILAQGGVVFFFSIFSFCLFFFIKDRSYLFFGFYTLSLTLTYLIIHSDIPFIDLFVPEYPVLSIYFGVIIVPGILIFFLLFGRAFINLPSLSKHTDKTLKLFITVWIVFTVANLITVITRHHSIPVPFATLFFTIITFTFVVRFAFFKTIFARLYIIGGLWLLSFFIIGFLDNSFRFMPFDPWSVGQLGQLLIFAVALAYRIKMNEQAKAEADNMKQIDEIKSRFFANISHEFRTPLTLLQGPLQQIEENINPKEGMVNVAVRQIKTMRHNTDRLLELVNQLLDLSKIDSGKMELQIVKGDVIQLMKGLTHSFDSMAERKGIHFYIHFPEQTHIAFFDKDKLEKIISNLLTNAFKYTPEQGTVSVSADIEDKRLRFTVEDNGSGIPKKELDKIFERFYQLEGTEDKGSGIGLSLVKELVDLYRGQISVNSEPGKGSRFKVSLPIDKSLFKEKELVYGEWKTGDVFINRTIKEEEVVIKESIQSQLPILLIVEDNSELRNFITESIEKYFHVLQAVNGKEGLKKAIAEIPDIIITDVMMPQMNGFEMTEKLRRNELTSHIPIILLTAKAGQSHKLEGLETGADDYLTKPFDAKELLVRIQNLINQRKLLRKKFAGEILLKPSQVSVDSADNIFLNRIMQAVENNLEEDEFGVEELAREVAISRSQLHRKLVALTGQSPSEVLRTTRLLRAKELLEKKAATPSEVAYKVGFNSHTYFSKCFREEFGVSPSEV